MEGIFFNPHGPIVILHGHCEERGDEAISQSAYNLLKLFISNAFLTFNIIEYYIIYLCLTIETKLLI